MVWALKIGASLLLLLVGAALIYPTAYAFAVPQRVRGRLNLVQLVLVLVGVGGVWADAPLATALGFAGAALITALVLASNAARRPKTAGPSGSAADPAAGDRSSRPPSRS